MLPVKPHPGNNNNAITIPPSKRKKHLIDLNYINNNKYALATAIGTNAIGSSNTNIPGRGYGEKKHFELMDETTNAADVDTLFIKRTETGKIQPAEEGGGISASFSTAIPPPNENDNTEQRRKREDKEPFKFLEGTKHLFLKKCKKFPPELSSFKPKNKRGLWNSSGRVVYYTGSRKNYCCRFGIYSGFLHEVVDYAGEFVIKAKGRQFIFGLNSYVEVYTEHNHLLGSMHQSFLSSTYEIKDATGRLIYIIQAPCFAPCAPFVFWCCNEHFEICQDDGITEIGRITKYWGNDIAIQEFQSCLGLELHGVNDVRAKGLLLGCFFLIEFQYYRAGGNGPIYFILMIIIFAAILLISDCAGQCPEWRDLVDLNNKTRSNNFLTNIV